MKKILVAILAFCYLNSAYAKENKYEPPVMADAELYFIYKDKTIKPLKMVDFKVYEKYPSEVHSYEDNLKPGGFWNLELMISDKKHFKYKFWRSIGSFPNETGRKDEKEVTVDISTPRVQSYIVESIKDEGDIVLNIIPKMYEKPLDKVQLTSDNFGLQSFCFDESPVIVDDSYYMGTFTGFGEYLVVGVPDLAVLSLSLKPLLDWEPIGKFVNGHIVVKLDGGHFIRIFHVGMGPSGYQKGGPFTIFGKIDKPNKTRKEAITQSIKFMRKDISEDVKKVMIEAIRTNPFVGKSRGSIGTHTLIETSDYIDSAIGSFSEGQKCG